MKLTKIIPFLCLGIISSAAIGVGVYFIVENFKDKDNILTLKPFDWKSFGNDAKFFSQKNSFKVSLTASYEENGNYLVSSGTAWSFYLDDVSSDTNIKWYLFTNFHVVNDPLYYNQGSINNGGGLFYNHNVRINKGFALYDSFDNQEYRPLITSNWGFKEKYRTFISTDAIVDVITDNVKNYNNNDDLDLFSNSSNTRDNFYNLDMSIIKITLSKVIYNKFRDIFNKIANPFKIWKDNNALLENIDPSKETYIAGNPGKEEKLVASSLPSDSIQITPYDYLNVGSVNQTTDNALRSLYFSSYSSIDWIKNWNLSAGASGSAVYQLPLGTNLPISSDPSSNEKNIFYNLLPLGIYWGGAQSTNNNSLFKPSFIPFKSDRYNIFANFSKFLNSKYNN